MRYGIISIALLFLQWPALSFPGQTLENSEAATSKGRQVAAIIGDSQFRHDGRISCLEFSRDGQWVVSGGSEGIVKVWNATDGSLKRSLNCEAPIVAIAIKDEVHALDNRNVLHHLPLTAETATRQSNLVPALTEFAREFVFPDVSGFVASSLYAFDDGTFGALYSAAWVRVSGSGRLLSESRRVSSPVAIKRSSGDLATFEFPEITVDNAADRTKKVVVTTMVEEGEWLLYRMQLSLDERHLLCCWRRRRFAVPSETEFAVELLNLTTHKSSGLTLLPESCRPHLFVSLGDSKWLIGGEVYFAQLAAVDGGKAELRVFENDSRPGLPVVAWSSTAARFAVALGGFHFAVLKSIDLGDADKLKLASWHPERIDHGRQSIVVSGNSCLARIDLATGATLVGMALKSELLCPIAFDEKGTRCLVVTLKHIAVYDTETLRVVAECPNRWSQVKCCALSPRCGQALIFEDKVGHILSVEERFAERSQHRFGSQAKSFVFSPDESKVAAILSPSGGDRCVVWSWRQAPSDVAVIHDSANATDVMFRPNSQGLYMLGRGPKTPSHDATCTLYRVDLMEATTMKVCEVLGHRFVTRQVVGHDRIRIWSSKSGVQEVDGNNGSIVKVHGVDGFITSHDLQLGVSVRNDGRLAIYRNKLTK